MTLRNTVCNFPLSIIHFYCLRQLSFSSHCLQQSHPCYPQEIADQVHDEGIRRPMLCRPKGLCHDSTIFTGIDTSVYALSPLWGFIILHPLLRGLTPPSMLCRPKGLIITLHSTLYTLNSTLYTLNYRLSTPQESFSRRVEK